MGRKPKYNLITGYEFNKELKYAIKLRDEFKCKICKKEEKYTKQGLYVHHIDYNKNNNDLNNLVTLCPTCHGKTNSKRVKWKEYFSREFNIKKDYIFLDNLLSYNDKILKFLKNKTVTGIVPILRGGGIPAVLLSEALKVPLIYEVKQKTDVIIDEIVDFGMTLKRYKKKYPDNLFICYHVNKNNFKEKNIKPDFFCEYTENYIIYPWEKEGKWFKEEI